MKKYLMTGIAALALCAGFTSCSHDLDAPSQEEINELEAKKIVEQYNKAFMATFGKPADNQTWGFSAPAAARTRAFNDWVEKLQSKSGENKNLNEWGDPAKFNLQVPPQLTDRQKERVRKYFQTHTPLTYVDPGYTNFYIQQVYKGGTSPSNNPIMGNLTTEKYVMADANYNNGAYTLTTGSEHMDYLTVGLDANGNALHHVNDYNNGEWNLGTPLYVLNEGESANNYTNYPSQYVHQDQITLMLNSNTQKVGYANSTGSIQHNYACALVDPLAIDTWAREVYASTGELIGEDVYYNIYEADGTTIKIDNQKWQRSFVGLDFEGNDPYEYVDGAKVAAKVGDIYNSVKFAKYTVNGTTKYYLLDDIKAKTLKEQFGLTNEVYYLNNDKSHYAGTPSHLSGQDALLSKGEYKDVITTGLKASGYTNEQIAAIENFNNQMDVLDLDVIKGKIDNECAPVVGKGLVEWVSDFEDRGRDYIYSDWIVTLTKAVEQGTTPGPGPTPDPTPTELSLRVMAEDLSVSDPSHDFDFNDVVFDVIRINDNSAKIILQAAGGTLPLRINSNNGVGGFEVHAAFGVDTNIMVNTNWNGSNAVNDKGPVDCSNLEGGVGIVTVEGGFTETNFYTTVGNIRIEVYKTSNGVKQWVEMKAPKGQAASKFGCPVGTQWVDERVFINDVYNFSDWVQGLSYTLTRKNQTNN